MALLPMATGACVQPAGAIFPGGAQTIAWPEPPYEARVRYVGQLKSSADLRESRTVWQSLRDLLIGPEEPEALYGPQAVLSTDEGRRVWVGDPGGRCLHMFDLQARSYKKLTEFNGSRLLSPIDLCPGPEGTFFVCDSEDIAIHRLNQQTGAWIETLHLDAEIRRPVAVTYDAEEMELYVVDVVAHDIKVLSPDGVIRRTIGRRGAGPGEFNFPCDIVLDGELLWVADTGNHRVVSLTKAGEPVSSFGRAGNALGDMALPKRLAIDNDDHIYVIDSRFENVQIFDLSGQLLLFVGEEGRGPGQFSLPSGIYVDETDRIWVCDTYNRRVQVFDYIHPSDETSGGTP